MYRVFNLCVVGALYTEGSVYVLQELYIQGVQFVCCRSVMYRVFNLCVAVALYTECSICVLQDCYVQGVQFMCCMNVIYRVFSLCVAGALYRGCSVCVLQERYIQDVQFVCCRSVIYRMFNLNRTCGVVSLTEVCTLVKAVWCVRSPQEKTLTSRFVLCDVGNAFYLGYDFGKNLICSVSYLFSDCGLECQVGSGMYGRTDNMCVVLSHGLPQPLKKRFTLY